MGRRLRTAGGGRRALGLREAGILGKGPLDGRTLGPTDLGADRGYQGGATGRGKAGTGLREELLLGAYSGMGGKHIQVVAASGQE